MSSTNVCFSLPDNEVGLDDMTTDVSLSIHLAHGWLTQILDTLHCADMDAVLSPASQKLFDHFVSDQERNQLTLQAIVDGRSVSCLSQKWRRG